MKSDKKILIAFILNLFFSVFEFVGGIITGSVAIMSDSIHDFGDAVIIGTSYVFERHSKKEADGTYTYGYSRYSVIGSVLSTALLLIGSLFVIYNAILRVINPIEINYNGMILFGVVGAAVNLFAAYFTHDGHSLNQKAVSLHMLEDVLGWLVVLVGAVIMKFTDISILDPIMSVFVALFILVNALKNLKKALDLFLEKAPHGICVDEIRKHLLNIDEISDIHHIHIWSLDENTVCATMHVVSDQSGVETKNKIREELKEHGISHVTLEFESRDEICGDKNHSITHTEHIHHHHH